MTIAAGVRCTDGIMLCSDSEHTEGEGKYEKPKIFSHDEWLLVTGAGSSDYIRMAFDKLYERFLEQKAQDQGDARRAVEEVILGIYEKNIGSVFRVGEQNSPDIALLVAVRCSNGDMALLKTSYTSVFLSYAYEAVGVGSNVYNYWAKYLFKFQKSMEITGFFSIFILQEVKNAVPGCGGGTEVAYMPSDLSMPKTCTAFLPGGDPLAGFPQNAVNVLLDAVDLRDLDHSIGLFKNSAQDLKALIKSRMEMRNIMKLGLEQIHNLPPSDHPTPKRKRRKS